MVRVKKKVHSRLMDTGKNGRYLIILPALALLLLGAHGLRQSDFGLCAAFALLAGLLFTRQSWVRWAAVVALLWGGYVWADATVNFISFRQAFDLPWKRLAGIIAGVILFDAASLMVLLSPRVGRRFDRGEWGMPRAAIFVLTALGLALARYQVSFPILLADRYLPGWGWLEIFALAFYAQWLGGRMRLPKGHRADRPRIWAFFSRIFFLQLGLGLLGMERMLMTGTLHLPVPALIVAGPVFRGDGFFMLILFSVTLLLVGPAWCSHLCYIGAWDDGLSRMGGRPAPSATVRSLSLFGRGATLALAVGAAWALREMGVPGITAIWAGVAFGLIGVGVMVFASRRSGTMIHCTAYCPMGLVGNILGRISPWRIRIESDCTRCGACLTRCRYNALDESRLEQGSPALSCTLCGDCVSACAHQQIGYTFPGLSRASARTVFLVLVITLHAIFLGVARI